MHINRLPKFPCAISCDVQLLRLDRVGMFRNGAKIEARQLLSPPASGFQIECRLEFLTCLSQNFNGEIASFCQMLNVLCTLVFMHLRDFLRHPGYYCHHRINIGRQILCSSQVDTGTFVFLVEEKLSRKNLCYKVSSVLCRCTCWLAVVQMCGEYLSPLSNGCH
jgi:hypothetical protein